jgi:hypothetical protein
MHELKVLRVLSNFSSFLVPKFLTFLKPKLPIDLAFGLITEKERKPHTKYIQEIRERLVQAYKLASEASIKAQTKQKEGYDLRTRGA